MTGLSYDRAALADLCDRYGIAGLWVFGSVARGQEGPESDVDLLYELKAGARLGWEITDLIDELSVILGRPVDLLSRSTIHPFIRERVLAEARALNAA